MELQRAPPKGNRTNNPVTNLRVLRETHRAGPAPSNLRERMMSVDSYFLRVLAAALARTSPIGVLLGFTISNFAVRLSTQQTALAADLATARWNKEEARD